MSLSTEDDVDDDDSGGTAITDVHACNKTRMPVIASIDNQGQIDHVTILANSTINLDNPRRATCKMSRLKSRLKSKSGNRQTANGRTDGHDRSHYLRH